MAQKTSMSTVIREGHTPEESFQYKAFLLRSACLSFPC